MNLRSSSVFRTSPSCHIGDEVLAGSKASPTSSQNSERSKETGGKPEKKKIANQKVHANCFLSFPPNLTPPGSSVAAAADPEGVMTEIDLREQQQEGGRSCGTLSARKQEQREGLREGDVAVRHLVREMQRTGPR